MAKIYDDSVPTASEESSAGNGNNKGGPSVVAEAYKLGCFFAGNAVFTEKVTGGFGAGGITADKSGNKAPYSRRRYFEKAGDESEKSVVFIKVSR